MMYSAFWYYLWERAVAMKRLNRRVFGLLLAPVIFMTAISSGSHSISAYAEELTEEITIPEEEQPLAEAPKEEEPEKIVEEAPEEQEPVFVAPEEVSEEQELVSAESEETEVEDELRSETEPAKVEADALTRPPVRPEWYYDVCFYIRGNGIDAELPTGVLDQMLGLYSDPIRINEAVSYSDLNTSTSVYDGNEDVLMGDGMTASNYVSSMLRSLPDENAIKAVVPDFDPGKHYVVWYVIKTATTSWPNSDVDIHVDGVIRTRQNLITPDPEEPVIEPEQPDQPDQPQEPDIDPEIIALGQEVEIEIQALLLDENGNDATVIPYDGQEHMVGGFAINVKDKADHNLLEELIYNYNGALLRRNVYAEDGYTDFPVRDRVFSVNITGAYATVQNIGQAVVAFYSGATKLNGPEDIIIRDEKGNAISSYINVVSKPATVTVSKRPLIIEAGTSVVNNNGQTLTNDSYEILKGSLMEGHELHCVFNGSQTGVGSCLNEITSVTIYDANGKDVTDLYNIETKDGKLMLVDPSGNGTSAGTESSSQSGSGSNEGSNASTAEIKNGYETVKVVLKDGSVTYMNVPYRVGAANPSEVLPEVLGARRAGTEDNSHYVARLLVIFACAAVMAEMARRRNNH